MLDLFGRADDSEPRFSVRSAGHGVPRKRSQYESESAKANPGLKQAPTDQERDESSRGRDTQADSSENHATGNATSP